MYASINKTAKKKNYDEDSNLSLPPPPDDMLYIEAENPYESVDRQELMEMPIEGMVDYTYEIGSKGRGLGQFGGWIQHFCVSVDGSSLYACDPFNKRIQIISLPDRKCKHSFPTSLPHYPFSPRGIAVMRGGNICVNCVGYDGTSRIGIFTPEGRLYHSFGPGLIGQSLAMTVDPMDRITVVDKRRMKITMMSKQGEGIVAFPSPVADDCIRIGSNGRGDVIVPDHLKNVVYVLDEQGEPKAKLRPPGDDRFLYPAGVAVDAKDNIFVCDVGNHSIVKFDATGTYSRRILTKSNSLWRPHDISISTRGHLLVSEVSKAYIKLFGFKR